MKTINDKLPADKAQKELKQFATIGLAFGVIPLIVFGWLGVVGAVASARALILSKHPGNKDNPKLKQYKTMAVIGLSLSLLDLIVVALA